MKKRIYLTLSVLAVLVSAEAQEMQNSEIYETQDYDGKGLRIIALIGHTFIKSQGMDGNLYIPSWGLDIDYSFELSDDFSIIEINVPKQYIGKTIREIQLRRRFNILALTTIKKTEIKSVVGKTRNEEKVQGVASPDTVLEENDLLVIYGSNKDLRSFTNP